VRLTFTNRGAPDWLLLQRFGGKVGRDLAAELSRRHDFPTRIEFCVPPVLTGYSGQDESFDTTGHNGKTQTNVCSRTKGAWSVDIAAQPGRGIGRDIGRGEAVEYELDAFISKRHEQRVKSEGERQLEEAWKESVRAYEEKRRQMARLEWRAFHCGQAERHRATLRAR
jgi:hypothetical protein